MRLRAYEQQFGENLQYYRRLKNLTQQELGERIGIGHSSISLWEKGERSPSVAQLYQLCGALGCSPNDLLNKRLSSAQAKAAGLEWNADFPSSASITFTENILDGIHLFQLIADEGYDYDRLTRLESFARLSPQHLWNKINAAFQARGVELLHVERDHKREHALKEKYNLIHCFVARLDNLPQDGIADVPIRSEAVAFLAAKLCVPLIRGFDSVGMTGGQPVVRFFDLIPPFSQDLTGITWRSLLATRRQLSMAPMGGAANGIVSRLLYSQPHTRGHTMPFVNLHRRSPEYHRAASGEEREELDYASTDRRTAAYVQAAFLAVGSPDFDYRTAGIEAVNPEMMRFYDQLNSEMKGRCQGDLLLRLLDSAGEPVGSTEERQANEALVYSIDLEDLAQMVKTKKQVWILSEVHQKAGIIRAVLKRGLANCLVIENRIADALLSSDVLPG